MAIDSAPTSTTRAARGNDRHAQLVCLAGATLAGVVVFAMGDPLAAAEGNAVSRALVGSAGRLQLAAVLAMLATAALMLAAVRLGRRLPGSAGPLAAAAGAAVAVLLSAYYGSYAGGAVVGSFLLETSTAGLGEGTLVVANMVELTRFAPGLALLLAAVVARRALPTGLVAFAGLLVLLTLLPFTSWVAAILVPVWLGIAGAVSSPQGE